MSNYKVGDKFVVEIEEKEKCGKVEVFKGKGLTYIGKALNRLDRLDSDYINENFGELQDEAYEAGRKAGQEEVLAELEEALAKMEAYEKKQAEIKVGDVVVVNNDIKGVVLDEGGNEDELIVFTENACVEPCLKGYLRKTGEHLNEVQNILQQLGGASE